MQQQTVGLHCILTFYGWVPHTAQWLIRSVCRQHLCTYMSFGWKRETLECDIGSRISYSQGRSKHICMLKDWKVKYTVWLKQLVLLKEYQKNQAQWKADSEKQTFTQKLQSQFSVDQQRQHITQRLGKETLLQRMIQGRHSMLIALQG